MPVQWSPERERKGGMQQRGKLRKLVLRWRRCSVHGHLPEPQRGTLQMDLRGLLQQCCKESPRPDSTSACTFRFLFCIISFWWESETRPLSCPMFLFESLSAFLSLLCFSWMVSLLHDEWIKIPCCLSNRNLALKSSIILTILLPIGGPRCTHSWQKQDPRIKDFGQN